MADITIPEEAMEAAKRAAKAYIESGELPTEDGLYCAACLAMLRSWPGMYDNGPRKGWKHYTPAIILPLTEKS